jgi:myo-inositol-1(or 4)-monophosphatase
MEAAAMEAARLGGEELRQRFRRLASGAVRKKAYHDFVTEADQASEAALTGYIRGRFPDHAVMAEEGSPDETRQDYRWIIDPLDGTTNFIHGIPTFAVSVGLEDRDGLLAGVIFDPVHDEMFHASRGNGAWLNDRPIRCSELSRLDDALLSTGFPFRYFQKVEGYLEVLRTFMEGTSGVRRAGSAAMDLAQIACGRYDGFWETGLAPWDMAAGALLIREAGGIVTDFRGGDRFLEDGEIVAGGPAIHESMMTVVRQHLAG